MASEDATKRLSSKKQTLDDAYAAPANFLEIDVINPITHGIGNKRYTDYEVRMKVKLNENISWLNDNVVEWAIDTNVFLIFRQTCRCFEWKNLALDGDTVISSG